MPGFCRSFMENPEIISKGISFVKNLTAKKEASFFLFFS